MYNNKTVHISIATYMVVHITFVYMKLHTKPEECGENKHTKCAHDP